MFKPKVMFEVLIVQEKYKNFVIFLEFFFFYIGYDIFGAIAKIFIWDYCVVITDYGFDLDQFSCYH